MENTIISFLENLAKNYNSLDDHQKKQISEFYILYQFNEKTKQNDFSEKNLLKFLSLGWFIHEKQTENENLICP